MAPGYLTTLVGYIRNRRFGSWQPRRAVFFDGDDTLWETQPIYDRVKLRFVDMLAGLGLDAAKALERLDEVDIANVAKMGFSPQRFPTSMVETYELMCADKGITPVSAIKDCVHSLATEVFRQGPILCDGVHECLAMLAESFQLILYTLGDYEVQRRKIAMSGLQQYFGQNIYIVPEKSVRQLERILTRTGFSPKDVWLVGNSLRSDINPALELGIKCIWLDGYSWAYDDETPKSGIVIKAHSLLEVAQIIARDLDDAVCISSVPRARSETFFG